ncbi:hypothetical protein LTR97_011397 [Elasticomyces elasticus]|uniref:Uncharacterized protein n=1 Tax=Elasticomyces elasticus TaxID=574655 RepID=A0AAN7VMM5_9PEZI|nr:hypothetical protein LTR97_011397 [Elasticomyces elasticus]
MAPQSILRWLPSSLALAAFTIPSAATLHERDASTTIVAVTATTTITQTATNTDGGQGACNNFYGACVVYGGYGDPSYTTTIYASGPSTAYLTPIPTSLVTSTSTATEIVVQTTTVSDSGACQGFEGSCVVYNTADSAAATTVYTGNGNGRGGNGDGEIGNTNNGGGDGAIGSGVGRLDIKCVLGFAALPLLVGIAMIAAV